MDKCHTLGILIILFFMAVTFIETGMQHIYTVMYWLKNTSLQISFDNIPFQQL